MFHSSKIARVLTIFCAIALISSLLPTNSVSGQSNVQSPYIGIWISASELANLPTNGTAWTALLNAANANPGSPDIQNQDSDNDVYVLAKALVFARTGDTKYRSDVIANLQKAVGTEAGGRTLALGRNLVSYVIAADLVNLPEANPSFDSTFRAWLRSTLTENLEGDTLIRTHEERPNNWGTHAGASRAAVAWYLGDYNELNRTALIFRGWTGDRAAYRSFNYGELDWQCNPSAPVAVNPKGCSRNGVNLDGALPDELRRGGGFTDPPTYTDYAWESLQGTIVQALILQRAGYPALDWSDRAVLRTAEYLYRIGWKAQGDDKWQPWLFNYAYGTTYATSAAGNGKNMGWTDWTHGGRKIGPSIPLVTYASPPQGALFYSNYVTINVSFNKDMDPNSITASTFKVLGPQGALPGDITYDKYADRATFRSSGQVNSGTTISVELTTAIKDESGTGLSSGKTWSFNLKTSAPNKAYMPLTVR
jgi:hypothetical protein